MSLCNEESGKDLTEIVTKKRKNLSSEELFKKFNLSKFEDMEELHKTSLDLYFLSQLSEITTSGFQYPLEIKSDNGSLDDSKLKQAILNLTETNAKLVEENKLLKNQLDAHVNRLEILSESSTREIQELRKSIERLEEKINSRISLPTLDDLDVKRE